MIGSTLKCRNALGLDFTAQAIDIDIQSKHFRSTFIASRYKYILNNKL